MQSKSYISYYETLLSLQNEKNRLIHDMKYQHMQVIQMLDEKKYDECREYLFKISDVLEKEGIYAIYRKSIYRFYPQLQE